MESNAFSSAKNVKIRNIDQKLVNKKVRILGTAIFTKEKNILYLDDGTARIKVLTDGIQKNSNELIRVAGRVILNQNQEAEIKADYIQDLANLNKSLYLKVQKLIQKLNL
ncbi:MAG: hypothetical protein ACTSVY_13915 [Candidatus Helarchaeota archaeon]